MRVRDMLCTDAACWSGLEALAAAAAASRPVLADFAVRVAARGALYATRPTAMQIAFPMAPARHDHARHATVPSPASFSSTEKTALASPRSASHGASPRPAVKAKRKRANAAQLSALREVYAQTPFPSAEVRRSLARQLAMTPRSVQIWFQNQRQLSRHQPKRV